MLNEFSGVGNVGMAPSLQMMDIEGEQRPVTHLRVYLDRPIRQDDNTYKDKGGFWLTVSFWDKRAELAVRWLRKGTRIFIRGLLSESQWTDKQTGEERAELQLAGENFFIDPICIESIQYRSKARNPDIQNEALPEACSEFQDELTD